MRIGRIPYINCYPVYGAVDRGIVTLNGEIVDGVPSELNRQMAEGTLELDGLIDAIEEAKVKLDLAPEHGSNARPDADIVV